MVTHEYINQEGGHSRAPKTNDLRSTNTRAFVEAIKSETMAAATHGLQLHDAGRNLI